MDWKDAKSKLDELAGRAPGDENVVPDAVAIVAEQLNHLHTSLTHLQERVDTITSQLAALEKRVHEDVE